MMIKKIKLAGLTLILLSVNLLCFAQIETTILNNSLKASKRNALFFTNRPLVVKPDNTYTFQNKFTDKSNTLYFCGYNFDEDTIGVNYLAINHSNNYPTEKLSYNFLYDFYRYHRLERGIKNVYIVVGGYGKSFEQQVHSYMQRLKTNYGDSLFEKAIVAVYAWGTEDNAVKYYRAVRESKNGAADFAIFQHMLDEFVSDKEFFSKNPNDFKFTILFSSMGNNLFKEYLERREAQNIPLVKTYKRIEFVGSVAARNSFEEGKAFYNLHEMTDSVDVFVNSKDLLLKMSSIAHFKSRMGNKGPKNENELPGYINVYHIEGIITKEDRPGLGHDYLLTNSVLKDALLLGIYRDTMSNQ